MNPEEILVVNPGSTSTKLAIYHATACVHAESLAHDAALLARHPRIWDQFDLRLGLVREWARAQFSTPAAVVSLGGLFRPLEGGTYIINDAMIRDARANLQGEHASNLGCDIAKTLADEFRARAYVVDPVSVDELEPLARYSGHPLIERRGLSHALNIHACARRAAAEDCAPLSSTQYIIAHLGGGISIAPVKAGRIIDVNDASSGGPFSPDRAGTLPLQQFITLCFSGKYNQQEIRGMVMGKGGLAAYLGTTSAVDAERRIDEGDSRAKEVYEAMGYQIAKEIGAMAAVLSGRATAIILTGGLAASRRLTGWITERVSFIAPVRIYPGEDELGALALSALRVLRNEEQPREY